MANNIDRCTSCEILDWDCPQNCIMREQFERKLAIFHYLIDNALTGDHIHSLLLEIPNKKDGQKWVMLFRRAETDALISHPVGGMAKQMIELCDEIRNLKKKLQKAHEEKTALIAALREGAAEVHRANTNDRNEKARQRNRRYNARAHSQHLVLVCYGKKGKPGALSSRYARGMGKGWTTRIYCTQSYLAFLQEEKFQHDDDDGAPEDSNILADLPTAATTINQVQPAASTGKHTETNRETNRASNNCFKCGASKEKR